MGFTKNPRQLAAKASAPSAAKAPINRSFCFLEDMFRCDSLRLTLGRLYTLDCSNAKIVAENDWLAAPALEARASPLLAIPS